MEPATSKLEHPSGRLGTVISVASAGLVIGSISVIFCLSFAAIIYTGPLAPFLGQGIGLTLIGAVLMGIVGPLTLSYRGTICQPQDITAILLAVAVVSLADTANLAPDAAFATVAVLVGLSTFIMGAAAYAMGRLRLGYFVRYIPLPVISGFLAATGVLLIKAGFEIAVPGVFGNTDFMTSLMAEWQRWLPWLASALILVALVRIVSNGLIVPAVLVITTVGFYVTLLVLSLDLGEAREMGLLLGPFGSSTFFDGLHPNLLALVDWGSIVSQVPMIIAIIGMSILGTLLNASGLELALRQEIDFDRDLRGVGLANMAAGLGGGMVGYHLLAETLLARRIGIGGVAGGFSVAVVCAIGLVFGAASLSNLPIGLPALVIWFLGIDLLLRAVFELGRRLPWGEFAVVIVTPMVGLIYGFLPAIGFGVLIACVLFIANYAQVDVVRLSTTGATFRARMERRPEEFRWLSAVAGAIHIYKLSGYLFFGSAHRIVERIRRGVLEREPPQCVIVDLEKVSGLDITSLSTFERLSRHFMEQDVRFILTGLSPALAKKFRSWTAVHASHMQILGSLDDVMQAIEEELLASRPGASKQSAASSVSTGDESLDKALVNFGEHVSLTAGDVLLKEGAEAYDLFVLLTGKLKVTVTNRNGAAVTVNRLASGAIVGEVAYYAKGSRTASVIAETDATALRITAESLARMELESPAQAASFHRNLADLLARRLVNSTQLLREADV